MRLSEQGFTVFEPTDDGLTLERALGKSTQDVRAMLPPEQSRLWMDRVQKARSTTRTAFGIVEDRIWFPQKRDVDTFMPPDWVELALVDYGCSELDNNGNTNSPEVLAVDGLLSQIDQIKASSH